MKKTFFLFLLACLMSAMSSTALAHDYSSENKRNTERLSKRDGDMCLHLILEIIDVRAMTEEVLENVELSEEQSKFLTANLSRIETHLKALKRTQSDLRIYSRNETMERECDMMLLKESFVISQFWNDVRKAIRQPATSSNDASVTMRSENYEIRNGKFSPIGNLQK